MTRNYSRGTYVFYFGNLHALLKYLQKQSNYLTLNNNRRVLFGDAQSYLIGLKSFFLPQIVGILINQGDKDHLRRTGNNVMQGYKLTDTT